MRHQCIDAGKRAAIVILIVLVPILISPPSTVGEETLDAFDQQVLAWAEQCRDEIVEQFEIIINTGKLNFAQLFDTFYIPIPNTYPQKYHTQYDKISDEILQGIIDRYLMKDERLVFVVPVDRNGYLPTHNTKYSQVLTGNNGIDVNRNRTKRIFNDRTGLAAARNTEPYLLQRYSRDTGEQMNDLSVPIYVKNQHWGALRIGYRK